MQPDAGRFYVVLLDLFPLPLAQETVVHEHTGQLVTYGTLHEAAATAESTPPDRPAITGCCPTVVAIGLDRLVDDVARRPGGRDSRTTVQEVFDYPLAQLRMSHLGVPLHPVQTPAGILEGGDGRRRRSTPCAESPGAPARRRRGATSIRVRRAGRPTEQLRTRGRHAPRCGRTRLYRCGPPLRRGPQPWPGARSKSRAPVCRLRKEPGRPWEPRRHKRSRGRRKG